MQRDLTHPRKSSWATATMDKFKLTGLLSELSLLELRRDSQAVQIKCKRHKMKHEWMNEWMKHITLTMHCILYLSADIWQEAVMRDGSENLLKKKKAAFLCSADFQKISSRGWLGFVMWRSKTVRWSKQWACCVELVSSVWSSFGPSIFFSSLWWVSSYHRDVIRTDTDLIYVAQRKDRMPFVCVCVCEVVEYAWELVGVSPVDL